MSNKNNLFVLLIHIFLMLPIVMSLSSCGGQAKNCAEEIIKRQLKTVAIAKFASIDGKHNDLADIITFKFKAELSKRTEFFNISDRSEVQALLNEQKLRKTGMIDDKTVSSLGSMYSINGVITGQYKVQETWLGNPKTYTLFINVISLETGITTTFEAIEIPVDF